MGEVFLARATDLDKPVVVKRLLPELANDPELSLMFLDEAKLASRIHHPNVAQIFELGQQEGSLYLVMEYVAGHDLATIHRHLLKQADEMPLSVVCRVLADVAAALDCAHRLTDEKGRALKLVHRDVS